MKKTILVLATAAAAAGSGVYLYKQSNTAAPPTATNVQAPAVEADSVLLSFAFVGCNRVERQQLADTSATDGSSANLSALKRIFDDLSKQQQKPSLLFFLGDLVCAESTTEVLNSQLAAWCKLYNNTAFSNISRSGIELVAVPGNHEMLFYQKPKVNGHDEWPLNGSTDIWMKHMAPFLPTDRKVVTGPDSAVNRMTFSFTRKNVAFVVMNTDTYNPPTKTYPRGIEGQVPTAWILKEIARYRANPAIQRIFVLGHKPYYVSGQPETGHDGLPEGPTLWPAFNTNTVAAMLSAHVHDYQRMQPGNMGTYQIVAGNGGSLGQAPFFGYSTIHILRSGKIKLVSRGFDVGPTYYVNPPSVPFVVKDSTTLSWTKNANPYNGL